MTTGSNRKVRKIIVDFSFKSNKLSLIKWWKWREVFTCLQHVLKFIAWGLQSTIFSNYHLHFTIISFQHHFAPCLDKRASLHALISVLEQNDLATCNKMMIERNDRLPHQPVYIATVVKKYLHLKMRISDLICTRHTIQVNVGLLKWSVFLQNVRYILELEVQGTYDLFFLVW